MGRHALDPVSELAEEALEEAQVAQQQVEGKVGQLKEQKKAIQSKLVAEQHKLLLDRTPQYRDPDKFKSMARDVTEYLRLLPT